MIVLDEQLLGRTLETAISAWYPGRVVFLTDLRPDTVIKDEAIPLLLRQQALPTFVTINVTDFWLRVDPDPGFCLVCCAIPDSRAGILPALLRRLFQHDAFRSKRRRMGKIVRLTTTTASYYEQRGSPIVELTM